MRTKVLCVGFVAVLIATIAVAASKTQWGVHDMNRPRPKIVTPGTESTQEKAGTAPSDAIVLFDGKDLSAWVSDKDGSDAKWKVIDGNMQTLPGAGYIRTEQSFGDCQLHVEWATPSIVKGKGQKRGNSGVFLMGLYEIQVLDSFVNPACPNENVTYADGQACAVYGQRPPMVNASRGPGKWQSYDILFRAPVFDGDKLVKLATVDVLHNGVWTQEDWVIKGRTRHKTVPSYSPHAAKLPLKLQDHSNPVRYRNIWIRELKPVEGE